jgi:hypothetical protein
VSTEYVDPTVPECDECGGGPEVTEHEYWCETAAGAMKAEIERLQKRLDAVVEICSPDRYAGMERSSGRAIALAREVRAAIGRNEK